MLFLAQMQVSVPHDMAPGKLGCLQEKERERAQELQRDGRLIHLWRVAGRWANVSVFDVRSVDELHELLSGLPMFPYLDITVTPLASHPSVLDRAGQKVPQ